MNAYLRQMIGLGLLSMLLDMIQPDGESGKYAELGIELSLMLCMLRGLNALLGFLKGAA